MLTPQKGAPDMPPRKDHSGLPTSTKPPARPPSKNLIFLQPVIGWRGMFLLGALTTSVITVVGFFYTTSQSSAAKDAMLVQAATRDGEQQ